MTATTDLYREDNIARAWRWIKSNNDRRYKGCCRRLYSAYAVAEDKLLPHLRDRIRRGTYAPVNATKIYSPKASGILRPLSILSVEDQIAYQAAVNVVADRLYRRVRKRYYHEVFGHLYAGKSSIWFYRKWQKGYAEFNKAAREAFAEGLKYTASFDLTACYDSMDHGVLRHFLQQIGCDKEFAERLTDWLTVWTATDHGIYHHHGIPQGPLSSGLLSEVVLQHFDDNRRREKTVRYMRYVDDIRLFAKSEDELRQMLVRLDKLSKDIGLFPQSSKIAIHKVSDIEEELKSVSHPTEPSVKTKPVDQKKLRKRLIKLSPRFKVKDSTRFRYLIAHADPNSDLAKRMWKIYEHSPDYFTTLSGLLSKYDKLPKTLAKRLVQEIKSHKLYEAVNAAFVKTALGRLPDSEAKAAEDWLKKHWKPQSMSPDRLATYGKWLVSSGRLTFKQTEYACLRTKDWWARSELVAALGPKFIGQPSLEKLINDALCDPSIDVAISAAHCAVNESLTISAARSQLNHAAAEVLKEFGLIARGPGAPCGIADTLARMSKATATVNWRSFFAGDYRKAEVQLVRCRAFATTNASGWVNAMDSFLDWLLYSLYRRDTSLGNYSYGSIGSNYNSARLRSGYPCVQELVESIHERRYTSHLSHAVQRRSGKPTLAVKFSFLQTGHQLVRKAVTELSTRY